MKNDETFNGGNLAAKPQPLEGETLPGQSGDGTIRMVPLYTVDPKWPCAMCSHTHEEHSFLYGLGTRDRYRCQAKTITGDRCSCGEQYLIAAIQVDPSEIATDEQRRDFIKRVTEAQRKEKDRFQR